MADGQRVLYSEYFNGHTNTQLNIIGKSQNFYWAEKRQKKKPSGKDNQNALSDIHQYVLFDDNLAVLNEFPMIHVPGVKKRWLMAGNEGLDEVNITGSSEKTLLSCTRFAVNKIRPSATIAIDSLAFSSTPSALLLIRSADHSKILLLAFEDSDSAVSIIHCNLYNEDWKPIYRVTITDDRFSQPCTQDDEIGFAGEGFDNLPVKLANDGQWLMASHSMASLRFSMLHVKSDGMDYAVHEFKTSPFYAMEDIAMAIDNEHEEISVGILSGFRNTTLKNVEITNYSMKEEKFDFASSYHFNEKSGDVINKNLIHENFISIPGSGYLLMREFGLPYDFGQPVLPRFNNEETAYLLANYSEAKRLKKDGYSFNRGLSPIRNIHYSGDLNLFYFPSVTNDSTWSGVLDIEQHTESNNPDLSYLLLPAKNRIYLLYNSPNGFTAPRASTTALDKHGEVHEEGMIFWKPNRLLNFQLSHRISASEIAVPYAGDQFNGFAIVRLETP